MGVFFTAFLKGFDEGRDRARSESYRRQDKQKIVKGKTIKIVLDDGDTEENASKTCRK